MSSKIHTEFEPVEKTDNGVEQEFVASEEFLFHGEPVERETKIALLEDGGIHISQSTDQGTHDSLTLNEDVVEKMLRERDAER